ncbi:hypothetical protein [Falsiroseomonas sp. E2-1-a4]|uniref:hypothetical protein n=1 Tax=Falsiroseomonas sp. E2-1-a4 TaxID=3239299 RepID=UPI003F30B8BF
MLDQTLAAHAATPQTSLRDAVGAVLAAWDHEANRAGDMIEALDAPMEALRTLFTGEPPVPVWLRFMMHHGRVGPAG